MPTLEDKSKLKLAKEKIKGLNKAHQEARREITRLSTVCKKQKAALKAEKAKGKAQAKALKKAERTLNAPVFVGMAKPKGHSFMLWIIRLSINLQVMNCLSYSQTRNCVSKLLQLMGLNMKSPSESTIRQWVQKQGCFELESGAGNTEKKIIIMDESVGIGQEKLFSILAISEKKWEENPSSLRHESTMVCGLSSRRSWNSLSISEQVKKIKGEVSYVVSDGSVVLKKSCELLGMKQVLDCTHLMANCVERYYSKQEDFIALQSSLGNVRRKMVNSKLVGMIAPNMRTKARFLNLFNIVEWLEKVLFHWDKLNEEARKQVDFVKTHKSLIDEIISIIKIIKELSIFLKNEGITCNTENQIQQVFLSVKNRTDKINQFEKDMQAYVKKSRELLPEHTSILCCSDVIESHFGKFKYRGNKAASQGITQDALCIPLFGKTLTDDRVKIAMESVSWHDVQQWANQNMVPAFSQTKLSFWENVGNKNICL